MPIKNFLLLSISLTLSHCLSLCVQYPPTSTASSTTVGSGTVTNTGSINRPELHQKCNRGSHSSDTSSAYSGSDTMASVYGSSLEAEEIDLSGLVESVVDSDEEDLAESMDVSWSYRTRE